MERPFPESSRLDPWTVGSLAVIAYSVANVVHEGLGHGGACLLVGGEPVELNAIFFQCSEGLSPGDRRWLAAGGSIANLVAAALAWIALRRLPRAWSRAHAFTWLLLAVNLLMPFGYLLFSGLGNIGVSGFGRTAASLLNLVMVVVPLMALLIGAMSVAGEREQGTLQMLLAQPVVLEEVLFGKFLGLSAALLATILAGFGLSALVIAHYGGSAQVGGYVQLVGYTCLSGLGYLSVGYFVSTLFRKVPTALGVALFLAQAVALVHSTGHAASTQSGLHSQLCDACLSFSTIFSNAGGPGASPVLPALVVAFPIDGAHVSLVDRATPRAFQSRAPPRR